MGNLGAPEVLVIFVLALIVLGPSKLPEAARQVGHVVSEVRRISAGFQREMRQAMQEPISDVRTEAQKTRRLLQGEADPDPEPTVPDPE